MPDRRDAVSAAPPELGRIALAGALYTVIRDFGRLPEEIAPARISQVAVDAQARVHVVRRGTVPVIVYAPDGRFLYSYGTGMASTRTA